MNLCQTCVIFVLLPGQSSGAIMQNAYRKEDDIQLNLFFLLALGFLFVFAWVLQSEYYFNADVSWLVMASRRLLKGGSYTEDFFELNPPLILYLYLPAVKLTQWFALSVPLAVRLYVFCLAALSLSLSMMSLQKIFPVSEKAAIRVMVLILTGLLLIFPLSGFSQREHFMLLLTLPYFFLLAARLESGRPCREWVAVVVGGLAAIGFCIKPYYLLVFGMVEGVAFCSRPTFRQLIRPETVTIGLIAVLYPLIIYLRHPDYLQTVLPLVTANYYANVKTPLRLFLKNQNLVIPCYAAIFYCLMVSRTRCR